MPPMTDEDSEQLAQPWIRHKRGNRDDRPASDAMTLFTAKDPEAAWRVTLRLIELVRDTELLGVVGAGPLEEIVAESSALFVDRIERLAATDPSFRTALSYVWLPDNASDASKRLIALGCTYVPAEDDSRTETPQ